MLFHPFVLTVLICSYFRYGAAIFKPEGDYQSAQRKFLMQKIAQGQEGRKPFSSGKTKSFPRSQMVSLRSKYAPHVNPMNPYAQQTVTGPKPWQFKRKNKQRYQTKVDQHKQEIEKEETPSSLFSQSTPILMKGRNSYMKPRKPFTFTSRRKSRPLSIPPPKSRVSYRGNTALSRNLLKGKGPLKRKPEVMKQDNIIKNYNRNSNDLYVSSKWLPGQPTAYKHMQSKQRKNNQFGGKNNKVSVKQMGTPNKSNKNSETKANGNWMNADKKGTSISQSIFNDKDRTLSKQFGGKRGYGKSGIRYEQPGQLLLRKQEQSQQSDRKVYNSMKKQTEAPKNKQKETQCADPKVADRPPVSKNLPNPKASSSNSAESVHNASKDDDLVEHTIKISLPSRGQSADPSKETPSIAIKISQDGANKATPNNVASTPKIEPADSKAANSSYSKFLQLLQGGVMLKATTEEPMPLPSPFKLPASAKVRQSHAEDPGTAQLAIDGDRYANGVHHPCSTSGQEEMKPWWEVDFGQEMTIRNVLLYNRGDCCSSFMSGLTLSVDEQVCNTFKGPAPSGYVSKPAAIINCLRPLTGRVLRISKDGPNLILCEVEWF